MSFYYWLIFTVIAVVIEILLPTFFALFIGVGCLAASLAAFFYPGLLFVQLLTASFFMILGAIVFNKKNLAETETSKIGTHDEFLGIKGKALSRLTNQHEGDVELYESVIGNRHWKAISLDIDIETDDEIEIIKVFGNTLIVKKQNKG